MDPNEALKQIRMIINNLDEAGEKWDDTHKLKELFDGLDNWIANGGMLPDDWKKPSTVFIKPTGKSVKCPHCNSSFDVESINTVQEILCENCCRMFLYNPMI